MGVVSRRFVSGNRFEEFENGCSGNGEYLSELNLQVSGVNLRDISTWFWKKIITRHFVMLL